MSVQDSLEFDPGRVPTRGPADTREAPGLFSFNWDATKASVEQAFNDVPGRAADNRDAHLIAAAEELARATGRRPETYYMPLLGEPASGLPAVDERTFWRDLADARRSRPDLLADLGKDSADFDKRLQSQGQAEMEARSARMSKGGLVGNLAGGIVGSFTDPINVATLPIGGGGRSVAAQIIREGLLNAGVEVAELPFTAIERNIATGGTMSAKEAALNVGAAGLGGAAFAAAGHSGAAALEAIWKRIPMETKAAMAMRAHTPDWALTPEQAAALHVTSRGGEIDASNPFPHSYEGLEAHARRMDEVLGSMARAPEPRPVAPLVSPRAASGPAPDFDSAWRAIIGNEGGTNRDGSFRTSPAGAIGPAQVMPGTAPEAARLAGLPFDEHRYRTDHAYNDALGRAYYGEMLRQFGGDPVKAAAAYNAGPGSARRGTGVRGAMMRAERAGTPGEWASFLPAETRGYVANFRRRTGIDGGAYTEIRAAQPDVDLPPVRPDALDAVRPSVAAGGREVPIGQFRPDEIGVDAPLMQFKAGGDVHGVTDRLRGVEQWDPIAAGMVTVWEGADGRRLIADGHQRLGLANRIAAADPTQDVRLNAMVLREADGFTARDARVLTALKNIGEGTGTATDAGKVFRDVGIDPDVLRRLPPRSALVRDGKSLARLSDEAFGAVINDVVPESYGAAIGEFAPDPATHSALVDVLATAAPANRRQADAIVRQAVHDGFTREHQDELFGTRELVRGLYAQRAKVLDRTLAELRKLKGAFGVAARHADALDAAGNHIDVSASEAAALANARALDLVDGLALSKGNAVNAAITHAAERLAAGEPLAGVVRDTVTQLRELDLERALRNVDEHGSVHGSGEPGIGDGGRGRDGEPDGEVLEGAADLTPATLDELEAAGQLGFFGADETAGKAFDDPAGDGIAKAADDAWHDIEAQILSGPALPPVPQDHVRMWHGGGAGTEAKAAGDGARWFSTNREYAANYGNDAGDKSLFYVDVPVNHSLLQPFNIDEFNNVTRLTANVELPEADALRMRPVPEQRRADPNLADRQRQEAQLRADAPLRGENATGTPQDGSMGLPMFDAADQRTFDLGDGRGERTLADIREELANDESAIATLEGCL
jgi:hypothetical protein